MTYQLTEKLQNLVPYQPIAGEYSVRLDANESFISLPEEIRQEIGQAITQTAFNRYPDPYAVELCQRFGQFFQVKPDLVVAANGSDELLFLLTTCFAKAGDRLLVTEPDFSMYRIYGQMAGLEVEVYAKDNDLLLDAEQFIAYAQAKQVDMVIFSNPCNPTSQLTPRADVLKIVETLDCLVVVDEAYMDFSQGSVLDMVEQYDNLMVLKTFSKAFGMAAVRLGFAIANPVLTKALKAAKSPYNVNTMSQIAGSVLLGHPDYLRQCIADIKESRDDLYKAIKGLKREKADLYTVYPPHGNFIYVEVEDSAKIYKDAAEKGIAIRLMGKHLRIAAGSNKENRRIYQVLQESLQ